MVNDSWCYFYMIRLGYHISNLTKPEKLHFLPSFSSQLFIMYLDIIIFNKSFIFRKPMSMNEILATLEEEPIQNNISIYCTPPVNDGQISDEDSDDSDLEEGNMNHIGKGILQAEAHIDVHHDDADQQHIRFLDEGLIHECKSKVYKWCNTDIVTNNLHSNHFSAKSPSTKSKSAKTPLQFFQLFFDDCVLDHILKQTNLYSSHQKNTNLNVTKNELIVFLGGLMMSGYVPLPNKRLYWDRDDDVPKLLSNSIRCNRFEAILHAIHMNDNSKIDQNDRLYKLRPFIELIENRFLEHAPAEEYLSIDESMIPYYGRHYAKQFIRGKPIRFGFKNWALCTSSGYMLAFDIYLGKQKEPLMEIGLGGTVVLNLLSKIDKQTSGYKVFFDNFFTTFSLMSVLSQKKISASGTMRLNRLKKCPLPKKEEAAKKARGSMEFRSNQDFSVIQWVDNNVVYMASTFEKSSVGTVRRYSQKRKEYLNIPIPTSIQTYNRNMGGVDLMDQSISTYRTHMRQRKWWWPIFIYFFDVSVVNAWILSRKYGHNMQLIDFKRHISKAMLKSYGIQSTQGRRPPSVIDDVRYDGLHHYPRSVQTEKLCRECRGKSKFVCTKCEVGVHPKCFEAYHRQN